MNTDIWDRFICPNGRYVRFKNTKRKRMFLAWNKALRFMNVKIAMIVHQSKLDQCQGKPPGTLEYDLGRTKSKGQKTLEDDEKSAIYARRKVEVESVFGHIKPGYFPAKATKQKKLGGKT